MRILITLFIITLVLASCGSTGTGPQYDLKGYDTESIGSGGVLAAYNDAIGNPLATGTVLNGVRNGTWITYHPETNKIKTISNYINGKLNGIVLTLNDRGQIEAMTNYKNDQLHGLSATYRFGRAQQETTYKDGAIDGPYATYTLEGKIQKKGEMKNGKLHGTIQNFDEEGNVITEYIYENGEKISGGIVSKPAAQ